MVTKLKRRMKKKEESKRKPKKKNDDVDLFPLLLSRSACVSAVSLSLSLQRNVLEHRKPRTAIIINEAMK